MYLIFMCISPHCFTELIAGTELRFLADKWEFCTSGKAGYPFLAMLKFPQSTEAVD